MNEGDALLQQVIDERERRCATLRTAAESQATQILRAARAEARANVRRAVTEARARMDLGIRQATARADIEFRRLERRRSRELLREMWAAIAGALESRWREASFQRAWIDAVLSQAGSILSGRAWVIEVGSGWPDQERGELTDHAHALGAGAVEYSVHADIAAGLKIRAATVCVDATVAGLLAERDTIEAAFLAEYTPVLAAEERTHG
jgi:hypothetical protein